jgi:DNA polymerase III gamma/tau subunit|tara:strand:+ start:6272 stop:7453 length:1182 start_codon:yes stop_codon:yes gene_type:complete
MSNYNFIGPARLVRRGPIQGASLYAAYRPLRFKELYGSAAIVGEGLKRELIKNDRKLSTPAIAFTGGSGTGKTTLSLIVALALNCQDPQDEVEPCLKCIKCIGIISRAFEGTDRNYIVKNSASMKLDDTLDMINSDINSGTALINRKSGTRVIALEEAHNLTKKGIESLLLPIEMALTNPRKPRVHLFLTTSEKETLFSSRAWQSRVLTYNLHSWTPQEIYDILVDINMNEYKQLNKPKVSNRVLEVIIKESDLSLRHAITLLQAVIEQGTTTNDVIELQGTGLILQSTPEEMDGIDQFIEDLVLGREMKCYQYLKAGYTSRKLPFDVFAKRIVSELTTRGVYALAAGNIDKGQLLMSKAKMFNDTLSNSIYQDRFTVVALATVAALTIGETI